jgi:hypothetical protein
MDSFEPTESDFDSVYGSRFLSAGDITAVGGKKRVKIAKVEMADLRQDSGGVTRRKFILYFEGQDKGMVLNVTNAGTLKEALGKSPAKWVGVEVGLYVEQVTFGNKRVPGLRLKVLLKPVSPPVRPASALTTPVPAPDRFELDDNPSDWVRDDEFVP